MEDFPTFAAFFFEILLRRTASSFLTTGRSRIAIFSSDFCFLSTIFSICCLALGGNLEKFPPAVNLCMIFLRAARRAFTLSSDSGFLFLLFSFLFVARIRAVRLATRDRFCLCCTVSASLMNSVNLIISSVDPWDVRCHRQRG